MEENNGGQPDSGVTSGFSDRGGAAVADPPPGRSSSSVNDALASLAPVTAQLDTALAPLRAATAPLQGTVAPLEAVGKQVVAYVGAALLFIGVFLPAQTYSFALLGSSLSVTASLWNAHFIWGFFVLLSAIVGAAAAAVRMFSWLWLAAIVSLVSLVIPFLSILLDSNWSIGWGWIVLIVGWLALGAAAVMRDTRGTAF